MSWKTEVHDRSAWPPYLLQQLCLHRENLCKDFIVGRSSQVHAGGRQLLPLLLQGALMGPYTGNTAPSAICL